MRGLAAMLVICHHVGLLMLPLRDTIVGPTLAAFGVLGMTLFFVLSGFVIHYNYAQKIDSEKSRGALRFLVARFARLYPLFLLFIVINFAGNLGSAIWTKNHAWPSVYLATLPFYLTGTQSWFYAVFHGINLSVAQRYASVAWSISTELFLYLLFIPVVLSGKFATATARRGILILIVAIICRIAFVQMSQVSNLSSWLESSFGSSSILPAQSWLIFYSPYGRCFEFFAGMGLAEIWLARHGKPVSHAEKAVIWFFGLAGIGYILLSFVSSVVLPGSVLFLGNALFKGYVIAVPAALYFLCTAKGRVYTVLCAAPLLFIGEISYSLYLLHADLFPLLRVLPRAEFSHLIPEMLIKTSVFFILLFVLAWLSYRFVEMPARKRVMKIGNSLLGERYKGAELPLAAQEASATEKIRSTI